MLNIQKSVLSNGLKVVHSYDDSTQMVALNLLYKVGAKDESPDHTGFAHLFEHLMFGGSANIPDFDTPLQLAGGENNAWTNNDITNYYLTVPKQNVETAFWLESDRMLSLAFTPDSLEAQRSVVIEEFKQRCLNQPYGDVSHLLRALAYKVHPYSWPTIGKELSHIVDATLDDVKAFFFSYYVPNNAVLAITGNISFEETVRLAEKWFAPIPYREVRRKPMNIEPLQTEERRLEVERNVPLDSLFMAFHMCERLHADYYAYDILSDVLSNGRSSRLNQSLVQDKKLFSSIDAYISGTVDAGLFHITGKPAVGVSLEQAELAVWEELERLRSELIDVKELEKVKNKFESTYIFGNMNYLNLATNLAWFEMLSCAEDMEMEVEHYRQVSAEHLREVASQAFQRNNCSVIHYKKKDTGSCNNE
ncbi:pitrilysin family protein [uncultured Bacteroides sp.]|uniref:M16 family metallopeptidase n=1 Tax=uncultured Bacteroides sp. TaxID=162156 RepID=UPI002AAA8AF0|nr:pitrilysin family protein [uncultured Bacteroides sp.]